MARGPRSVSWQVAWVPSLDRGKLIKVGTQLGLAHPAGGRAQARLWGLSLGGPTPLQAFWPSLRNTDKLLTSHQLLGKK